MQLSIQSQTYSFTYLIVQNYGSAKKTSVNFETAEKAYPSSKTTEHLIGARHHSIGPTNYTSNISQNLGQANHSSQNVNSLQFPTIESQEHINNGALKQNFIKQSKYQLQALLKSQMKSIEPFKGYIEISNLSKNMKNFQENTRNEGLIDEYKEEVNRGRLGTPQPHGRGQRGEGTGVTSKVMETWINETLQDAQHLDIPGVILKPEHKNPISRYSIDRITLTNAGVPNELVDRVYKCLFVYSVGFYELIKTILQHSEKKYQIITNIWKVFSVLLEYCCQSDYRMLIAEISNSHKAEIERMEQDFQKQCQEFLNNEKILKQNMEVMQKYSEELEKERTNERNLRLKLEEEYMQNSKNHEEEVQLRLKFESKLNSMHSMHRELEIKHKRTQNELSNALATIEKNEQLIREQTAEIIKLKSRCTDNESKIELLEEKKATLEREVALKNKLVSDIENKMKKTQEESDNLKSQVSDYIKKTTEHKLKIDVLETKIEGLNNDKAHLEINLSEERKFKEIFETKNAELREKLSKLQEDYNEIKSKVIGYEEIMKDNEARIEQFKDQVKNLTDQVFELDKNNNTLKIELEKHTDYYEHAKKDLDEAVDKLHQTNRVRHELEIRLMAEQETNVQLQKTIDEKIGIIGERDQKIDELTAQTRHMQNKIEQLEATNESLERQMELKVNALTEKTEALNEILKNEKDARETWADRYEKEQKEHTQTNTQMLLLRSQIKDLELEVGNYQISLQTQQQINEQIKSANETLQESLNLKLVEVENVQRENITLKQSLNQIEQQKKDFSKKMQEEFKKMVEERELMERNYEMEVEDVWCRGADTYRELQILIQKHDYTLEELENYKEQLRKEQQDNNENLMHKEDLQGHYFFQSLELMRVQDQLQEHLEQLETEKKVRETLKNDGVAKFAKSEKQMKELQKELAELKARYEKDTESLKEQLDFQKEKSKDLQESLTKANQNLAQKKENEEEKKKEKENTYVRPPQKNQEVQTTPLQIQDLENERARKEGKNEGKGEGRQGPGQKLMKQASKNREGMNKQMKDEEVKQQQRRHAKHSLANQKIDEQEAYLESELVQVKNQTQFNMHDPEMTPQNIIHSQHQQMSQQQDNSYVGSPSSSQIRQKSFIIREQSKTNYDNNPSGQMSRKSSIKTNQSPFHRSYYNENENQKGPNGNMQSEDQSFTKVAAQQRRYSQNQTQLQEQQDSRRFTKSSFKSNGPIPHPNQDYEIQKQSQNSKGLVSQQANKKNGPLQFDQHQNKDQNLKGQTSHQKKNSQQYENEQAYGARDEVRVSQTKSFASNTQYSKVQRQQQYYQEEQYSQSQTSNYQQNRSSQYQVDRSQLDRNEHSLGNPSHASKGATHYSKKSAKDIDDKINKHYQSQAQTSPQQIDSRINIRQDQQQDQMYHSTDLLEESPNNESRNDRMGDQSNKNRERIRISQQRYNDKEHGHHDSKEHIDVVNTKNLSSKYESVHESQEEGKHQRSKQEQNSIHKNRSELKTDVAELANEEALDSQGQTPNQISKRAKNQFGSNQGIQQSQQRSSQNKSANRKVVGQSTIKTMIRAAATRD